MIDSPHKEKLRKIFRRRIILEHKHKSTIKSLRKENFRLKKENASLKNVIYAMKKQKNVHRDD